MLPYLVHLESRLDVITFRPYDPGRSWFDMRSGHLTIGPTWHSRWLEEGVPSRSLLDELATLEGESGPTAGASGIARGKQRKRA